jgi:motility quorum-sensing regulator/GCU-specific mRNA interferase toxin
MEKKIRHYALEKIKDLVLGDAWRVTDAALEHAWEDFEFERLDIRNCILGLESMDFYKSMTSYIDNTVWQDVYRPKVKEITAYIKISIIDDNTIVVQFKRK